LLLSATLMERPILVLSPNLGVLSSTTTSVLGLGLPFVRDGLCIPVLPLGMAKYVAAPVPYIMGLPIPIHSLSKYVKPNTMQDVVILGPETNCLFTQTGIALLPDHHKLYNLLQPWHKLLHEKEDKLQNLIYANSKEREAARHVTAILKSHIQSTLIIPTEKHYGSFNLQTTPEGMVKTTFLQNCASSHQEFMKAFLNTQMFAAHVFQSFMPLSAARNFGRRPTVSVTPQTNTVVFVTNHLNNNSNTNANNYQNKIPNNNYDIQNDNNSAVGTTEASTS
jgi:hypothetical protein